MDSLVPIFRNPRTGTVHHFKRLPMGSINHVGITACGREEVERAVYWSDWPSVTCRACIRAGRHIVHVRKDN